MDKTVSDCISVMETYKKTKLPLATDFEAYMSDQSRRSEDEQGSWLKMVKTLQHTRLELARFLGEGNRDNLEQDGTT